jgi:hypothetical protein
LMSNSQCYFNFVTSYWDFSYCKSYTFWRTRNVKCLDYRWNRMFREIDLNMETTRRWSEGLIAGMFHRGLETK